MGDKNKSKLSWKQKQTLWGYLFALPFIIGFILFFLYPFIQSIIFSLTKISIKKGGYILESVGLKNYNYALFVHVDFLKKMYETFSKLLTRIPIIIMFSFFAAHLLNQKFKGRFLARLIFFLPIAFGSGIILQLQASDYMQQLYQPGTTVGGAEAISGSLLDPGIVKSLILELKLPQQILNYFIGAVDQITDIIRSSGIQILIFLAGFQSIPSSLYEVAKIEGGSAWENFWKITFPLVSPLILVNIIYTIIDSFIAYDNQMMELIKNTMFGGRGFGAGSAMAWFYFSMISILLIIVYSIISRFIIYQE